MEDNGLMAVHNDDLEKLLKSLNAYDDVKNGNYHCIYCGNTITLDNLDAIIPVNESVRFSCNSEACHLKLITNEGANINETK